MRVKYGLIPGVAALALLAGCMMPGGPGGNNQRFLVYFDEFSANLGPDALKVVGDAAAAYKANHDRGIRIEGRASATGSEQANHYLAATRSQVVADALQRQGIDRGVFQQVWVGETGSGDTSVADRRVDIVLQP